MHIRKFRLLLFPLILSLSACSSFEDDGRISEGIIEYEVSYPKIDKGSVLAELLPNKMTMSFKKNVLMTDLSAGFGMFRMNIVSNSNDKELAQMVKLIDKKLVVKYDELGVQESVATDTKVSLERTNKTKEVAGFKCKEIIVTLQNEEQETFNVYYTTDIHIDQPNWFTNLTEIDGVMLEYQVERYGLCSKFSATNVVQKEIDETIFSVPEDYDEISEQEMNDEMQEIFNSLSE